MTVLCGLTLAFSATMVFAQPADRPDRPPRFEGGPGRFERPEGRRGRPEVSEEQRRESMERARERMAGILKERLDASDDEWSVIEPRIQKMIELRPRPTGMGFRGGRDGEPRRGPGARPESEVAQKHDALRKAVESDASPEKLKQAMAELRAARAKQQVEAEAAEKSLREVLSVRQEAVLVSMGILD